MLEDSDYILAEEIKSMITSFVDSNHQNYCNHFNGRFFDAPLVGFSRADDNIFTTIKEQVGTESWTPHQALLKAVQESDSASCIKPEEVSVISWVLPINSVVREKNRLQKSSPADEWCYTRNDGERFNVEMRQQVVT